MNTHTSQQTLRNTIQQLELERARIPGTSPIQIEQEIQRLTPRVILDPTLRASLADLIENKRLAEQNLERVQEINSQIARLNVELDLLEGEEKRHQVEQADKRLSIANEEFAHAARLVIRAYRKCLTVAQQNQSIPGAHTGVPKDFVFGHLRSPYGSQAFSTAQEMRMGRQRYEDEAA